MPCFYCIHCGKCGGDSYGYSKVLPGRCARCGFQNEADATSCSQCGAPILPIPGVSSDGKDGRRDDPTMIAPRAQD